MKKWIYLVIVYLDELEKENRNCKRKILNFDHRMKKKIKIIHKPFGAFLYADHVLQLLSNIVIKWPTIKRL